MAVSPKLSVILSSYNHAKYLREAIESVLNQTYENFELIIWDDASTDDSWDIISSYSDNRIRKMKNETNEHGQYLQRAIFDVTKGEYIAIHHSDDIWEHQKLEKQVAFLNTHSSVGAVFTNLLMVGERGEPLFDETSSYQTVFDQPNRSRYEWLNYFFNIGNALCHPSILIRRVCYDTCGAYRSGFAQLPDFDLWVRLCMKYDIHIMPEKLLRLRVRSNEMNTSANRPDSRIRRQFEFFKILDNFRNVLTFEELLQIFPSAEKYARPDGFDAGFILGMTSLESETFYGNITHLFGLTLLFEALNDPDRASKIAKLYDFKLKDFVELSGRYDIFSVELAPKLVEKEQKITTLVEEKNILTQMLLEIHGSRAWKLVTGYREIQARLISVAKFTFKKNQL